MLHNCSALRLLAITFLPLALPQPHAGQQAPRAEFRSETVERFRGEVTLRDGSGAERSIRLILSEVAVPGGAEIETLAAGKGAVVVELRGGEVDTTIGGEARTQQEGSFWSADPNASTALKTGDDTALLQVLTIIPVDN